MHGTLVRRLTLVLAAALVVCAGGALGLEPREPASFLELQEFFLPELYLSSAHAPLAAMQIAEAQLGLVNAWVTGRSSCAASDIADALASTSRAVAEALSQR